MPNPPTSELQSQLEFALELAGLAQQAILPYFHRCTIKRKADGTEVTEADRAAEERMRARIEARHPSHGILGEEFGTKPSTSGTDWMWVLDPLDGTAGFTLGMPNFGTLIALLEGEEPVLGVCHFPALGETVYAAKGLGCWWRPAPAQEPMQVAVADPVPLSEAVVSGGGPHSSDIQCQPGQTPYRLSALIHQARKFRFVLDCQQHALVCRGRLHAAVDTVMAPWDIAALVPCVEEAGGVATTVAGNRQGLVYGGSLLTSCNPALHREVVETLRPSAG